MMIKCSIYKDFTTLRETRTVKTASKIMWRVMKGNSGGIDQRSFFERHKGTGERS